MRTKKNFSKAIVIVLALAAIATFTAVFNNGTDTIITPVAPESTGSVDYVNDPEAVYNHEDVTTNGKTWDEVLAEREERDKNKDKDQSSTKPVLKNTHYTYADGTKTYNFVEFLFDNLIENGDAKRAILDTLVKSGVTNKMAGQTVHSNSYGTIDVTHANEGYVTLKLTKNTSKKIQGAVDYTDADGKSHLYNWYMDKGETYAIPTYFGDGKYTVSIFEHVNGNSYALKLSVNITVKSDSPYQTFLHSTRQADFEASPNATAKAKELTANCKTDAEKINVIYNWVYDNIKYDKKFLDETYGSNCTDRFDLDTILENGKGTCRHRSALVAGMLRSIGIPCRVTESKDHSWIQVWYETGTSKKNGVTYSEGAWIQLDTTSRSYASYAASKITNYA